MKYEAGIGTPSRGFEKSHIEQKTSVEYAWGQLLETWGIQKTGLYKCVPRCLGK